MYRAGLEFILGFKLRGDRLSLEPCIPRSWREYEITYRRGATHYHIKVENPYGASRGVANVELDGEPQETDEIVLTNDSEIHRVRVVLGEKATVKEEEPAQNML
jgi:cyclic beta-1,2-glucan synthetase